jgi:polar amino acid transport system substrate-binding protein
MKKLLLILSIFMTAVFAQDLGGRTVVVGSDPTYPPFEFVNEAGEIVGFDIDVVNAICERINCVAEFRTYAWDGIVAAIGAGVFTDFDMVASGVSITEERSRTAAFSDPYLVVNQAITVRVENEDLTLEDFTAEGSTLTLAAQLGTTNADLSVELVGEGRTVIYDDFNSAILALLQGDVNGVIIDGVTAEAFVDQYAGELVVEITGLSNDPLGLVFEQGDELIDAFNAGLAMISEDGTLDELVVRWFGE